MAEKSQNQVVVLEPVADSANELLTMLRDKNGAEIIQAANSAEAAQIVNQYSPCMLICSLKETPHIPLVVSLLKMLEKSIKQGAVKTLVISKIPAPQLASLISGLGVTDYILEPFPARTLYFKCNLQLKAIESIKKTQAAKKAAEEKVVFKKAGEGGAQDAQSIKEGTVPTKPSPALALAEDTFLFRKGVAKKTGKKMMVEMDGPPPETGEWVQHSDPGDPETRWRWVDEDEKDSEAVKNGDGWVHAGEKPTYNEANKKWQMNSEKPDLSLYRQKNKVASKVKLNSAGEIEIAEDSPEAETKLRALKVKAEKKKEEKKRLADEAAKEEKQKIEASHQAVANKLEAAKSAVAEKIAAAKVKKEDPALALKSGDAAEEAKFKGLKIPPAKKKRFDDLKKKLATSVLSAEEHKELHELEKAIEESGEAATVETSSEAAAKPGEEKVLKTRAPIEKIVRQKKAPPKKSPLDFLKDKRAKLDGEIGEDSSEENTLLKSDSEDAENSSAEDALLEGESAQDAAEEPSELDASLDSDEEGDGDGAALIGTKGNKAGGAPDPKNPNWRKKTKPKKRQKEDLLRRLEQELNGPVDQNLSAEEEAALREEFGDKDKKELTKDELVQKKKFRNIKNLKKSLADLDNDFDPSEGSDTPDHERNVHDLSAEDPENKTGEAHTINNHVARSKLQAYDSDLEDLAEEEKRRKLEKQTRGKKRDKKDLDLEDEYIYKEENEILPLGGAWEKSDDYYVYLAANTRFKPFDKIADILPVWIFSGDEIPEFINKDKKWRFWKIAPILCETEDSLPLSVLDFLHALHGSKKEARKDTSALDALKDKLANAEKDSGSSLSQRQSGENGDSSASLSEDENNKKSISEEERLARELSGIEDEDVDSQDSLEAGSNSMDSDALIGKRKDTDDGTEPPRLEKNASSRNKKDGEEDPGYQKVSDRDGKNGGSDDADEVAKVNGANKTKKKNSAVEDFLAARKAKLGAEDQENPEQSSKNRTAGGSETDGDRSESEADAIAGSNKDRDETAADGLDSELKNKGKDADALSASKRAKKAASTIDLEERSSVPKALAEQGNDAIKSFLERRKNKSAKHTEPKNLAKEKNPYLAIYVAFSDAFRMKHKWETLAPHLLGTIAGSIDSCEPYILGPSPQGESFLILASGTELRAPGTSMILEDGFKKEISVPVGSEQNLLGYFYVRPVGDRRTFNEVELAAFEKVTRLLASLMNKEMNLKKQRAA